MSERKTTVLIVDDHPENIRVLSEILRSEYRVLFATRGIEALDLAHRELPDLILLDVMMPEMDGYTVCTRLKEEEPTRDIPVIFITALDQEQHETLGLELGAVDYITKPVNPVIVRLRVRNHLELKRHRDFYKNLSNQDGLTAIANRRRFDDYLAQEWRRSIRSRSQLSLIILDIDHFKAFNDHYGHAAGDECLRDVAKTLELILERATDLVARFGGEEFGCVLPETGGEGAMMLAERLRQGVASLLIPHARSSVADHITISVGVATCRPTPANTPLDLLKASDRFLYRAKYQGRNQVVGGEVVLEEE